MIITLLYMVQVLSSCGNFRNKFKKITIKFIFLSPLFNPTLSHTHFLEQLKINFNFLLDIKSP